MERQIETVCERERGRDKTRHSLFPRVVNKHTSAFLHSALTQRGTNLLRIHTAIALLHALKTYTLSIKNSKEKRTRGKNQQQKNKTNKQNEQTNKSQEGTQNTEGGGRERERKRGREVRGERERLGGRQKES